MLVVLACCRCRAETAVAGRICRHCKLEELFWGWEVGYACPALVYKLACHLLQLQEAVAGNSRARYVPCRLQCCSLSSTEAVLFGVALFCRVAPLLFTARRERAPWA